MAHLVWFRRDLRITDHPALYHACEEYSEGVVALFLISPDFWQQHDEAVRKIQFYWQHLAALQHSLAELNIPLIVKTVNGTDFSDFFSDFLSEYSINSLHYNIEIEPNEIKRDQQVASLCENKNIKVYEHHNRCIIKPGDVMKMDGTPYTVFTPFKKRWLEYLNQSKITLLPAPRAQAMMPFANQAIPELPTHYAMPIYKTECVTDEPAAKILLKQFVRHKLADYKNWRDFPAKENTSRVSPYLVAGTLSPRHCLIAALSMPDSVGKDTWISELIWREFYHHILFHFPRVGKHRAFNLKTESIPWNYDQKQFQLWCEGKTGVPIIDAAMRQLNQTGWMHNRLRMCVAMFLTKNLFIDWRWGERYFMQQLLDGDLPANNGGWQWSASTGTDAAPYFRVFNPYLQSAKFDPDGEFIRHFCPELTQLDNKAIHCPPLMANYPPPIVDIDQSRKYAIETFKRYNV